MAWADRLLVGKGFLNQIKASLKLAFFRGIIVDF